MDFYTALNSDAVQEGNEAAVAFLSKVCKGYE
jgi:hypothetical protein